MGSNIDAVNQERLPQRAAHEEEDESQRFIREGLAQERQRAERIAEIRQIVRRELAELFPERIPEGNYLGYVLRGELNPRSHAPADTQES